MSDEKFTVSIPRFLNLRLRTVENRDLENLRIWKNRHKNSFFLKRDITPAEQNKWFENFKKRKEDVMFVVEYENKGEWEAVGCMGFRELPDEHCVDAYNIMRGKEDPIKTAFTMSDAFRLMLVYAVSIYENLPIRCKVLCDNPAVDWYKKNNFLIIETFEDYYLMELDKNSVKNLEFIKI